MAVYKSTMQHGQSQGPHDRDSLQAPFRLPLRNLPPDYTFKVMEELQTDRLAPLVSQSMLEV